MDSGQSSFIYIYKENIIILNSYTSGNRNDVSVLISCKISIVKMFYTNIFVVFLFFVTVFSYVNSQGKLNKRQSYFHSILRF